MYDYEHTQPGTLFRVALGFWLLVFLAGAVAVLVSGVGAEKAIVPIILAAIFAAVIALVHSLTVRVSHNEIRLSFGVGLIQKSFLIDDIEAAATARNRWYNGWGIKKIRGGWLYNVSGFDAVEIQLNSGRRYRIGTDKPRELLAAVESAMAQSG
ncbi:MAG: hypothetical protein VB876_20535 [Pirellulales bacterium]